jgi:hypothetical protein
MRIRRQFTGIVFAGLFLSGPAFLLHAQNHLKQEKKPAHSQESKFVAQRQIKERLLNLAFPAAWVFPLLCPEMELKWVAGWQYEMVYSKSGFAEADCVFKTHSRYRPDAVWVVSQYDPGHGCIEFVIFMHNVRVEKLHLTVEAIGESSCRLHWNEQIIALSEEGNDFIAHYDEAERVHWLQYLGKAIDHYFSTGKILKND